MSKKGPQWERDVATMLSEWWTQDDPNGPNDAVFWRTASSGARATTRGKKGKQTKNAHGDQLASDPIGQPLIDFVMIECKKGYSNETIHALLDRPAKGKMPMYGKWIVKAQASAKAAGVPHWMIISKRDRRDAMAFFDLGLWWVIWSGITHAPVSIRLGPPEWEIGACKLSEFLRRVRPQEIIKSLKYHRSRS